MFDSLPLAFARPQALWLLLAAPALLLLGAMLGRRRGGMARSAPWLRAATVALLALAIAEPLTATGGDATNTIFVVDRSKSLTATANDSVSTWLAGALDGAGGHDRAAVVGFGSSPVLVKAAGPAGQIALDWGKVDPAIDADYTDVESALALARALPVGGARRIVLLSDGAENLGSALNQAAQAATDKTPIDVLPLPGVGADDLRVEGAVAPSAVWSGETVHVTASVASGSGGTGTVSLVVDGVAKGTSDATFRPGLNTFGFDVPGLSPGFHAMAVNVASTTASDPYPGNDGAPLSIVVRDAPKVMLLTSAGSDPGRMRSGLERKGAKVTLVEPKELSSRLSDLGVYDAFVLDNVAASSFSIDQLTALREATRTLGKGLVVLGGTGSYGPGSYAGTVLEDALPVTVKVTEGKERQRVALLLIVDKSGSMSMDSSGQASKIEMAKQAMQLAARALSDGDSIGILAFSDTQQWVVKMTAIDGQATRGRIDAAIQAITADGGTQIYPALQVGFDAIRNTAADVRHVVLLSDGKSSTGTQQSYKKLIDDTIGDRTTLSTIAIGNDADQKLLQALAARGNGRYHFTEKAEDIPQVTLQEAQSAGSQSVVRGTFHPIQSGPSPIMTGFDPKELPALDGYDYAKAKPDAQVVLSSERDDPLLAKWQLGLGRVVAWTGDDGVDFASLWPAWQRYDEFFAGVVRWSLPDPENRPIDVTVKRDGPEAVITVNAVGDNGSFVDLAATSATITGPDGAVTPGLALYQSGPGEYQLRVHAPLPGAYKIALTQQRGAAAIDELAGFTMPPSPELQPSPDAAALLRAIAERTGGRVLSLDDASSVFSGGTGLSGSALRTYRPVWRWPLTLALMLLLVELALRMRFFGRLRGLGAGR